MNILDIHTHHPAPRPEAVVDVSRSFSDEGFATIPDQLYSAGIHPWDTASDPAPDTWTRLEELLASPQFAAVGEVGVDLSGKGGMLFRQLQVFRRLIDMSENLHKPLIVHCVKAEDIICGLIRDLKPTQPWVIHGFRKKPAAAEQLLRAGCYISLGQFFNPDTLHVIPDDRLLAETDESDMPIRGIIDIFSTLRDTDMSAVVARNSARVLALRRS